MSVEVCVLNWQIAPFRADRFLDLWEPAVARMPSYGARDWSLTRAVDDPLSFQQTSTWENRKDFERWWFSDEVQDIRATIIDLHVIPILPTWHKIVAAE